MEHLASAFGQILALGFLSALLLWVISRDLARALVRHLGTALAWFVLGCLLFESCAPRWSHLPSLLQVAGWLFGLLLIVGAWVYLVSPQGALALFKAIGVPIAVVVGLITGVAQVLGTGDMFACLILLAASGAAYWVRKRGTAFVAGGRLGRGTAERRPQFPRAGVGL